MRDRYVTVKIPAALAARLDKISEDGGYRSRAEIVNDAIRRFLVSYAEKSDTLELEPVKWEKSLIKVLR